MRLSEPRVTPLAVSEMSEEQREIVNRAAGDQPLQEHHPHTGEIFQTLLARSVTNPV